MYMHLAKVLQTDKSKRKNKSTIIFGDSSTHSSLSNSQNKESEINKDIDDLNNIVK